jgi:hypothetical protein
LQVLPALQYLDPNFCALSPATVHFIVLSATTVAAALLLFRHSRGEGWEDQSADVPQTLVSVATTFSEALLQMTHIGNRFSSSPIEAVRLCLDNLRDWNRDFPQALFSEMIQGLVKDTGVVDIYTSGAENVPSLASSNDEDLSSGREAIQALCAPEARACRQGCFDISIQF